MIEISWVICSASVLIGILYAILLNVKRETSLEKPFLRQGLFAISLIVVLYIYGEQDRFFTSISPKEDLTDFSFILFMVTFLWILTSLIFRFFENKFSKLSKPIFLLIRGATLLLTLIPLDVSLNYLFLDLAYDLPLYEDYWVLEVPFKILVVLLVNFLDVIQSKSEAATKPFNIKVRSGNSYRIIELNQIAYFSVKNQISYLYTITGEKYVTDLTLVQLEKKLRNYDFFRANRQLLIARKAVEGYRSVDGKKIALSLSGTEGSTTSYCISRLGAPSFRKWIKHEVGTIQP
ncbi:MAG: LytTR family DNA-binding domain-containing protein [Ekhidna sp.]